VFRVDGGGSVCRAYRSRGVDDGIDIGLSEQVGSLSRRATAQISTQYRSTVSANPSRARHRSRRYLANFVSAFSYIAQAARGMISERTKVALRAAKGRATRQCQRRQDEYRRSRRQETLPNTARHARHIDTRFAQQRCSGS
jgi:hypothetical protein